MRRLDCLQLEHTELVSLDRERNQRLYWLVLVSREKIGKEIFGKNLSVPANVNCLFKRKVGIRTMAASDIEWTEATWNPIAGARCSRPAAPIAMPCAGGAPAGDGHGEIRRHHAQVGQAPCLDRRVNVDKKALAAPLAWKRPQRIFVNSMSDLFQDNVDEAFIRQVWGVMGQAPWHSFQVLTKRPERMLEILSKPDFPMLPNVWLGASVESEDYVGRIDLLRQVPAHVRFVSFEPLLGPIINPDFAGIHWAIIGGEFGPRARRCRHGGWSDCTIPASGRASCFSSSNGVEKEKTIRPPV